MLSWQRIPARNQELLMCNSKAHLQFALMPQILLVKSLHSMCYFFPSFPKIYLCSFFTLFTIFTGCFYAHKFGRAPRAPAGSKSPLSSPTTSASGSAEYRSAPGKIQKKTNLYSPLILCFLSQHS